MSKRRLIIQNEQKEDQEVGGGVDFVERESDTVIFDNNYVIGNAAIRSGNILFDFTNPLAILGKVSTMRNNRGTVPVIPEEGVIIKGSHVVSVTNYYWFCLTKATEPRIVQITIGQ